jgi:hypothetical protein
MSKATRQFFEGLKDMVGNGIKNFIPDVVAELQRQGRHGSLEICQGLWNGNAFTPYGPGAYTKDARGIGMRMDGVQAAEGGVHGKSGPEQERGGREM